MTVKKCDACGEIYEKGFALSYTLDPYEVNKSNAQLKKEYSTHMDLCEKCKQHFEDFIKGSQKNK